MQSKDFIYTGHYELENAMDLFDNPMGTDGFEFVEYTAPDTEALGRLFESMGFSAVARHRSKRVTLYKQGGIHFIVNAEPDSFAQSFARVHGPSACAFGIRVKDAAAAFKRAVELGARPYDGPVGPMELNIPAIQGIGGSLLYLIDRYGPRTIYDVDFVPVAGVDPVTTAMLTSPMYLYNQCRTPRVLRATCSGPGRMPP